MMQLTPWSYMFRDTTFPFMAFTFFFQCYIGTFSFCFHIYVNRLFEGGRCHVLCTWYILFSLMFVCFRSHSSHLSFCSSSIPFVPLPFLLLLFHFLLFWVREDVLERMYTREKALAAVDIYCSVLCVLRGDVPSFFLYGLVFGYGIN